MVETIFGFLSKIAGAFAKPIVEKCLRYFKRPKISLDIAPSNILEFLTPGTAVGRMKSLLGNPHREGGAMSGIERVIRNVPAASNYSANDPHTQFSYEFKDLFVQVRSEDKETISQLMLVSRQPKRPSKFPIFPLSLTFGTLRLDELLDPGEEAKIDSSVKHYARFVNRYYGAPGNYLYFTFGSLEAVNVTRPADDRVNWVVVSRKEDGHPYFDWAHFI